MDDQDERAADRIDDERPISKLTFAIAGALVLIGLLANAWTVIGLARGY